jgi:hypothetical protein
MAPICTLEIISLSTIMHMIAVGKGFRWYSAITSEMGRYLSPR